MTYHPTLLRIAVPVPLRQYFDYLPPKTTGWDKLSPGSRVKIPFGRREVVGIFMGFVTTPDIEMNKLKPIIEVIDDEPIIPDDILQLCLWAADYYHAPIGEVFAAAMPALLRQGKSTEVKIRDKSIQVITSLPCPLVLNNAQQAAISSIDESKDTFKVFLLDGVTGSGKTEVYLQNIKYFLDKQKQVLVLLPEIGLTPQTIQRFRERFDVNIVALNSKLTEKQRLHAWNLAKSGEAKIVIGTRSAVFTPFKNLGLIIIDEEHDLSFKQQDGFRYHARDLAIKRAHTDKIPIVLGSATPSLETLHNAKQNRFQHLELPERAGIAQLPSYHIFDIRNKLLDEGLSEPLLKEIKNHLARGEQVMLFLNRRGFSPVLMCHACGWLMNCKRCDTRMTYHQHPKRLHCHHCDSQKPVISKCEKCGAKELIAIGLGTERLEIALQKHFPDASIARIDKDSTRRKGAMEKILNQIQKGEHQILIGTQMLAKGHHFPNVTLVAIVDTDAGFFSSDFRSLERTGQLLLQVAGRAGRVDKPGSVIIQTRHPDHPLLHQLLNESYQQFAASILQERDQAALPPYSYFALFRAEAHQQKTADDFLQQVKALIDASQKNIQLLGPISAPMPKRAGRHRVQLLVQSRQRPLLQSYLKNIIPKIEKLSLKQRVRWSLDVDPLEMF